VGQNRGLWRHLPQTPDPSANPGESASGSCCSSTTLTIYGYYWVFKTQDEVKNHSGRAFGGVLGLVIYIVVGPVTWFLVPSEVGKMYQQDGRTAPFTGWTGLWLLLPIVGPSSGSSRSRAPESLLGVEEHCGLAAR
jgi:hypothetical protein